MRQKFNYLFIGLLFSGLAFFSYYYDFCKLFKIK